MRCMNHDSSMISRGGWVIHCEWAEVDGSSMVLYPPYFAWRFGTMPLRSIHLVLRRHSIVIQDHFEAFSSKILWFRILSDFLKYTASNTLRGKVRVLFCVLGFVWECKNKNAFIWVREILLLVWCSFIVWFYEHHPARQVFFWSVPWTKWIVRMLYKDRADLQ